MNRRATSRRVWALLTLVVGVGMGLVWWRSAADRGSPLPVPVAQVRVTWREPPPPEESLPPLEELAAIAREVVGVLPEGEPGGEAYRLEVGARIAGAPAGKGLELVLVLSPTAKGASVFRTAVSHQDPDGGPVAWREIFRGGLHAGLRQLDRQMEMASWSTARLLAELSAEQASGREQAVRLLGGRAAEEAVEPLLGMLHDPVPAVRLATVGALVTIGDRRAVAPLIELSLGHQEAAFCSQIYYALSAIGGSEARAFLFTIATGHPDERVRQAARDALLELVDREGEE